MELSQKETTANTLSLVKGLLEELSRKNIFKVSVKGAATDGVVAGFSTFLGGLVGGRSGAIAGGAMGLGALAVSKALGYGDYLPLMTALKQNFTEEELNSLYERMWEVLQSYFPFGNIAWTVTTLVNLVEKNPELMNDIKNELMEIFGNKNMQVN